jgi:GH15 family glucan-1,4-alpha-glucosidase
MSYQPIENYGMIGNMRTVALIGMNGSIDWYCYPHFDSPSVFGAIVDDKKGGRFQISADSDAVRRKQFYWPSTNVLRLARHPLAGRNKAISVRLVRHMAL